MRMGIHEPLCNFCKHRHSTSAYDEEQNKSTYFCDAYPEGIPEAVYHAGHFYPKPGDNGIQFELREGMKLYSHTMGTQEDEDETYHWYEDDIAQGLRVY